MPGAAPPKTAALAGRDRADNVRALLVKSEKQIKMALPRHIGSDHLMRVVMTAVQMTPKLLDCEPMSLIRAVLQAAALGLEPNDGRGHAYLIPYGKQVQLIPGDKGLIDLARRSDAVGPITARVVREGDSFKYAFGTTEFIEHRPRGEDGDVSHAYAVARLRGYDVPQFDVMEAFEIIKIRNASQGYLNDPSGSPWAKHFAEMAKKTVIRRLCKLLPQSIELVRAVELDDQADAGISQVFEERIQEITAPDAKPRSLGDAARQSPPRAEEPRDAEIVEPTTNTTNTMSAPAQSAASAPTTIADSVAPAAAEPDPRLAGYVERINAAKSPTGVQGILGQAAVADLSEGDFKALVQLATARTKAIAAATVPASTSPTATATPAAPKPAAPKPATAKAAGSIPISEPPKRAVTPVTPSQLFPDGGAPACGNQVGEMTCARSEHPPDESCRTADGREF